MKTINRVIKILIISDFFLNCGWGLLGPVFAIFIVQKIAVGSAVEGAKIAGFASLSYWLIKSLIQVPIGKYLDKNHGEKDDFVFLVAGTFVAGVAPFGYLFSYLAWHIYAFQALHAVGMAMAVCSWAAIFTRHIDKGQEAFEWSMESTSIGLGAGIAGALGGILVAVFNFDIVFILTGGFTILAASLLILIRKEILSKNVPVIHVPPLVTHF